VVEVEKGLGEFCESEVNWLNIKPREPQAGTIVAGVEQALAVSESVTGKTRTLSIRSVVRTVSLPVSG
jgi:hypothetical protein